MKRGRGSQCKSKVPVMSESPFVENTKKGRKPKRVSHIKYYLNVYYYKFNRRYFGDNIFDGLIITAVSYTSDFKSKIYYRTLCG